MSGAQRRKLNRIIENDKKSAKLSLEKYLKKPRLAAQIDSSTSHPISISSSDDEDAVDMVESTSVKKTQS